MENSKINLLPYKQRWYLMRQRLAWFLQGGSMVVGIVYGVVLVGVFGWQAAVAVQLKNVERRSGQVKQEIGNLAEKESLQVGVKSKLARMVELEKQRIDVALVLKTLIDLFPQEVEWQEIAIKPESGVEVKARTTNAVALAEVIEALERNTAADASAWKEVKMDSLTKSLSGEYGLTLVLVPK